MTVEFVVHGGFLLKRGDIGAIGDDIPSIFPIVAGVLLFITTILYVNPQYEARNNYLELRKSGIAFSYYALSDGYLSDKQFVDNCPLYKEFAARRGVKFVFSLKKACQRIDLADDVFSATSNLGFRPPISDAEYVTGKICSTDSTAASPTALPKVNGAQISTTNLPKDFQIYSFPVAVQCDSEATLKGVGVANIVVWQR